MIYSDMCADIATLLHPLPADLGDTPDTGLAPDELILDERECTAESLRHAWDDENADPLLSTLAGLREQRLHLESQMRQLVAYGRRFTHPRPYKLIDLASAAGMSISGVRTAYEDEEVQQVGQLLGRAPLDQPPGSTDGT
jgi:hypothetical protein